MTIGADGEAHLALLKYNAGECEYWPLDWRCVAPHEMVGKPPRELRSPRPWRDEHYS